MTKDEFIKTACEMGYCNKEIAKKYCEGKDTFTVDDYIEVYRKGEAQRYHTPGHTLHGGGFTSKRYYRDGGSEGNR